MWKWRAQERRLICFLLKQLWELRATTTSCFAQKAMTIGRWHPHTNIYASAESKNRSSHATRVCWDICCSEITTIRANALTSSSKMTRSFFRSVKISQPQVLWNTFSRPLNDIKYMSPSQKNCWAQFLDSCKEWCVQKLAVYFRTHSNRVSVTGPYSCCSSQRLKM